MSALYRYPGVKPFEQSDAALFFGRERDQTDLLALMMREQLAVLFGKSGYGKSSLVKAGVMPALLAQPNIVLDAESGEEVEVPNLPIYVRLNLYSNNPFPIATLVRRYHEEVGEGDVDVPLTRFFQEKNLPTALWQTFKSSKTAATHRLFLIFDQFEEFFSYPMEAQEQFRRELSELLYTRIPQNVRDQMEGADRDTKRRLHRQMDIHTLFLIRSDRIHLLNSMREELPAILHARYELNALTESQAREAIVRPAKLQNPDFALKEPFQYDPAALQRILSELSKPSDSPFEQDKISIEAFQLQMVCQTIEQRLINQTKTAKGAQPTLVKDSDLPDFKQVYEQYYADKLSKLPDRESQQTAHLLLEEVMAIGEDISDIRRVSMDKAVLEENLLRQHQRHITPEILAYLEDNFLIRRENISGHAHYEISHDVLLGPLLKSRNQARQKAARQKATAEAKEQQLAAEKRAKEAEDIAAKERQRREEAENQRWRGRILTTISLIAFFIALYQQNIAEKQRKAAVDALQKYEEAKRENVKQAFYQTITNMEAILKSPDGCPDTTQMRQLTAIPPNYPEDGILQERVENLKTLIRKNNCQQ